MKFTKIKNGYSIKEVDEYISMSETNYKNLLKEKDALISKLQTKIKEVEGKEKSIAVALTAAVDKAKEIETSSKNIYRLKIEQMTILCSKWEVLLNEMLQKYPGIEDVTNVKENIKNLKNVIRTSLKDDFNIELISKNPVTDPIRVLLSRLNYNNCQNRAPRKTKVLKRQSKVSANDRTELDKLEETTNQIKPIVSLNLEKDDRYENLVDKFLNSDEQISNTKSFFVKKQNDNLNESIFDINEAVNPTEDLDEIMKAFDFYKKDSGII